MPNNGQMKIEDCMFFGGPADGERRPVLDDAPQVLVRGSTDSAMPFAVNSWVYKRHVISSPNGVNYPIYVNGTIDPIRLLMKHYPVGKNK